MKRFLAIYIGTEAALEKSQWNKLPEEKRKALEASGFKAGMEWGPGNVQVNCLCPGFVDTEQSRTALWPTEAGREKILNTVPAGRFETIEETVECGLFLCAPVANYITGEVLVADGGQWLNKGVFVLPEKGSRYAKV